MNMKKSILFAGIVLCLISCKPQTINGLPEGWLEIPKELIKSYFFHGNSITYISENSDIKTFENEFSYYYMPYDMSTYKVEWEEGENEPDISEGVPCELLSVRNNLKNVSINDYLDIFLDIDLNRTKLFIAYKLVQGFGGIYEVRFENDPKKNQGMGYPKNPNEFLEHLTDTINLTYDEKLMGQLVAGKGLIWFTDANGIKWYLKE